MKGALVDPYVSVENDEARILLRIRDSKEGLRRKELLELFRTHRLDRDNRFMPFESLSRRENEVLCLLMEGHSVAKIAESSFVSVGTVRTQVKAILRKLGVNSQAAAVALAYRSGWAAADPSLPVDLRLPRDW